VEDGILSGATASSLLYELREREKEDAEFSTICCSTACNII